MPRRGIGSDDLTTLSKSQQLLWNIWDKASREGGLELPPMGKDSAFRTKFLLFAFAKSLRDQNIPRDYELLLRSRDLTVRMQKLPDGKYKLLIGKRVPDELMELAGMFGVEETGEQQDDEAISSLHKLQQLTTAGSGDGDGDGDGYGEKPASPLTTHNIFYSRS